MKTYYLKVIIILLSVSYSPELILSQELSFQKSFLIGGKAGISFSNEKTVLSDRTFLKNTFELPVEPNIGYFITNNIPIGIKLNYKSEFKTYVENNAKTKSHYIMLCPYARYYTKSLIFVELSSGFGVRKQVDEALEPNKFFYYNNSLGLGYALFLNRNISIEPILNYSLDYISVKTEDVKYVLEQNIFLFVSLQIYLNLNYEKTF